MIIRPESEFVSNKCSALLLENSPLSLGWDDSTLWTPPSISRRKALKFGAVGVATAASLTWDTEEAEAGFWGFIGASVFAAGIAWFVDKTLDSWLTPDPRRQGLTYDRDPTPTRNDFSNHYAAPYYARARNTYLRPVDSYGQLRVGWGPYLSRYDLNGPEVAQIQKEYEADIYDSVLLPCTDRKPIERCDRADLKRVGEMYDLDYADYANEYKRYYLDEDRHAHVGYGVTLASSTNGLERGTKRHLLA